MLTRTMRIILLAASLTAALPGALPAQSDVCFHDRTSYPAGRNGCEEYTVIVDTFYCESGTYQFVQLQVDDICRFA